MATSQRGFKAPAPGTPMCQHKVAWEQGSKLLEMPRPCKRAAAPGLIFCKLHAHIIAKRAKLDVIDGGFCVVCAAPARGYRFDVPLGGVTIALCRPHGIVLARAIREGR